ncbi:MAG: NifU family protein [Blastocatellia bacterium]|nr:NifU family protein [Blastocatellia bacterium]
MAQFDERTVRLHLRKIEELIQAIESTADPRARAAAVELMRLLLDLHGAGIERMMEIVHETGEPGRRAIDRLSEDGLAGSLLLLYGLHPLDLETRVGQALEKVRPHLRSHGGNVALLGIREGVVSLRLERSCHGCASSAMTLKQAIVEAIDDAAPDAAGLEVEGVIGETPASSLVQLQPAPQH